MSESDRRKMEVPDEVREQILELHAIGYGTRRIVPRVRLSRKVVRRVLEEAGVQSPPPRKDPRSLLDPFREMIREKVEKGLTAKRILREITGKGYRGGRTILVDAVRVLKAQIAPETAKKRVKRRFETDPGKEMQVDWSPYDVKIGGVQVRVHALGVLLCWSRKLFLGFYRDERESTLLQGLAEALEYFEGAAQWLVVDNMATAVLGRTGPKREPIWHPRFKEFLDHYGIGAYACRPMHPNRKGKKEKSFRYVYDDFVRGSEFESWTDLLARRWEWLDGLEKDGNQRTHGTTARVPNEAWLEEKPCLVELPRARFPTYDLETRIVDDDATLSVAGTPYTIPAEHAPGVLSVRLYAHHFEVVDRLGRVVFTKPYPEPFQPRRKLMIDPTHYATLPGRAPQGDAGRRLEEAFLGRFPELGELLGGIQRRMKALSSIHVRQLVRLAERFGDGAFLEAARRAQAYRAFNAHAVRRILETAHPIAPDEVALEPLGRGTGPVVLGEVDPASLDDYGELDTRPGNPQPEERTDGA